MPEPATTPSIACDLLVLGSGAGGLAAAVTAAHLGLAVVLAEKEPLLGGTTAWSGGWMWVPRNPLARTAGIDEDIERPLAYLRHELGERFDEARARAYLEAAPRMVDFFRRHTALQFIDGNAIPDFHGRTPDAATGGRSVCAAPFDARRLGARRGLLRPPLAETTLWGMGIASGAELRHFLNALRKPASFAYVARRVLGHGRDLLLHRHAMRLVNGHALAGALAASAFEAGVDVRTRHAARRLLRDGARVHGAVPPRSPQIWQMYKKAVASIWTAEEIDLSKDMVRARRPPPPPTAPSAARRPQAHAARPPVALRAAARRPTGSA